jgi:hypothetical protein
MALEWLPIRDSVPVREEGSQSVQEAVEVAAATVARGAILAMELREDPFTETVS